MNVREMMTANPACCTPETGLQAVARMMIDCDCGAIPVVEEMSSMRLAGIVTDRDITVRAVAEGKNPLQMTAGEVMSSPVAAIGPDMSLEQIAQLMEEYQVRRVPVVDENRAVVGIVAQADLALQGPKEMTGEVVEEISQPRAATTDDHKGPKQARKGS
jgi:CBS domain-containing protein